MQRERKVTPHNTRFPVKGAPIDPGLLRLKKVSLGLGTQSSFCEDKYLCKFLFFLPVIFLMNHVLWSVSSP